MGGRPDGGRGGNASGMGDIVGTPDSGTTQSNTGSGDTEKQMTNGNSEEASGTDISNWVSIENGEVSFALADAVEYRTAGASKAMPAFDVIDYGQEDYVFGCSEKDARHWNTYLLDIFEKYAEVLEPLFNAK